MTPASTVTRRHALEAVPLHPTLETLPLGDAAHVDILTGYEVTRVYPRAGGWYGVVRRHAEFPHHVRRMGSVYGVSAKRSPLFPANSELHVEPILLSEGLNT